MNPVESKKDVQEDIQVLAEKYLEQSQEMIVAINDVNTSQDLQDDSFLALGDHLAILFEKIETDDPKVAKKVFIAIKKRTAQKIQAADVNTINKVVKVARHTLITQYRKEQRLPNRWGSLYLLTSLSEEQLHHHVTNNDISPTSTRKQLQDLLAQIKGDRASPSKWKRLVIKRQGDKDITLDDKAELEKWLAQKGWELYVPKSKIREHNVKANTLGDDA
jgi:hypothetical protein